MKQRRSIDELFTDLADMISEYMGRWWVSFVSLVLVVSWTAYCIVTQGSGWWYGTFYNLPLNLCTTLAELWIGFLLAAATNRVEKRNKAIMDNHVQLTNHIVELTERMAHMIETIKRLEERELSEIESMINAPGDGSSIA